MPATTEDVFPGTALRCFKYCDRHADDVKDALRVLCGTSDTFPGPQPCSIDTSHFETMRSARYAVARKTDGVRACMAISRTGFRGEEGQLQTVTLYDRTMRTPRGVYVRNVPKLLYQGTVLDGEVVEQEDGAYVFLIFDCWVLGGMPQRHLCFWDRLRAIQTCLAQCYRRAEADDVTIEVKPFVSLHEAPLEEKDLASPYRSDGFVFMPVDLSIVVGHHDRMFKLKTCHSVDFLHKSGGELWVYNRSARRHVKAGLLAESTVHVPPDTIVECTLESWHKNVGKRVWMPLAVRTDKSRANDTVTLDRTLLNMEQRLTYADIRQLAPS
jgi:hypothetical protein